MIQIIKVIVDTKKTNYKNAGKINHGDDLILDVRVQSDGDDVIFENPIVDLLVKKSDGNMIRQNRDIEFIKPNIFNITLDKNCVTSSGLVTNQLLISDNGRVSTCLFFYTVLNSLEEDVIQSVSNVEVIEQLDEFLIASIDRMDKLNYELSELEENFNSTSEVLVEAENKRDEAEQLRIEADMVRDENDSIREYREEARVQNEDERVQNENERTLNEDDRINNENNRNSNESLRKSQENKRVSAETTRVNSETTRRNNENVRIMNEIERQNAMTEMKNLLKEIKQLLNDLKDIK